MCGYANVQMCGVDVQICKCADVQMKTGFEMRMEWSRVDVQICKCADVQMGCRMGWGGVDVWMKNGGRSGMGMGRWDEICKQTAGNS
jgi:hypothetical protein